MSNKNIVRFFKRYFVSEKKLFLKALGLIFISSIFGVLYGYLMGIAIDKTTTSNFAIAIFTLVIYLLICVTDNLIFDRLGKVCVEKIANNMMEKISYDVYHKVGMLPARAFEEKSSGELINRIVNDSGTIRDTFTGLLRIIITLWTAGIIFIYICFNSLVIALEIIIYMFIFYLFSKKFLPLIKENQKEITKEKDLALKEVNENIRGIREIRALGIREEMDLGIKNLLRNIFFKTNKQMLNEKNYWACIESLNNIFETICFMTCIILIIFKRTTFAFFMSLTYYIYRFMWIVESMMEFSTSYQKMKVSMERIDEIINNKLYLDEEYGNVHKTNIKGNIEFKNVNFRYSEDEDPIFTNLNLKLETGKKIAIVGKSGQGKTSIFNLLLRYFDVNEGVILIDDEPIKNFDEESFHQNIAIIRQEPYLFNKSILDNLRIVNPNLTLDDIRKCCKKAEIDDYIMSLKDNYDTLIGEGGVNLSGGQKQRLAIARALLKNSKIILFDEATSALDNESQRKVKKAIDNLVKNHTIIIIAHRLSTIIDADVIHVIDKGKVVASGTHQQLLKKNKTYQKLYQEEI